jgi:hypothetical protein
VEDARTLDELTYDLAADHVLRDYALDARGIDPIIQGRSTTWAGQHRKAGAERLLACDELAYQNVRSLCASAEAALPHQLRALARTVCV